MNNEFPLHKIGDNLLPTDKYKKIDPELEALRLKLDEAAIIGEGAGAGDYKKNQFKNSFGEQQP